MLGNRRLEGILFNRTAGSIGVSKPVLPTPLLSQPLSVFNISNKGYFYLLFREFVFLSGTKAVNG
jgi:hypothetical protein